MIGALGLLNLVGCVDAKEATPVRVAVVSSAMDAAPVRTRLGYEVSVQEARLTVKDLQFTTNGEQHAGFLERVADLLVTKAFAHPGHAQGGTVLGELSGRFIVDGLHEHPLGTATMVASSYEACNFEFAIADSTDVAEDDSLLGHTALIVGTARKDGRSIGFRALLDAPAGRTLTGVPFRVDIAEKTSGPIHFRFFLSDPVEHDTLLDELDFFQLDPDLDGLVEISATSPEGSERDAYFLLRRGFMTHDYFEMALLP